MLGIDGEDYELISTTETALDFWRSDTPLFDMVYEYLKQSLNEYFKQ